MAETRFVFNAAPFLWQALGVPSTKVPLDGIAVVSYIFPLVVCYFALAVLAVTPRTHRVFQLSLWPLMALLVLRAMLSIDGSNGKADSKSSDTTLIIILLFGSIRSLGWILEKEPLVRHLRPSNSSPSIIMDALDLAINLRGYGWNWSRRLHVPRETRPSNRIAFVSYAFLSSIVHALICGVCHCATLTLVPVGLGNNPNASTLIDDALPFPVRCLRAGIITASTAVAIYAGQQAFYDVCTIIAILFLGQDPAQWPPAFDAPWRATSLDDFWSRRWHQFNRQLFLLVGGYPLSLVLGRSGIVIGGFLASGLWHHVTLLTFDSQADMRWNLVGFGMMAPGVLAERAYYRYTGKRVGGVIGWAWTMGWLLFWGSVIFEGYTRAPMDDRSTLIDTIPALHDAVERWVRGFDDWLCTRTITS